VLIWLGSLGLCGFGEPWLAAKCLGGGLSGHVIREHLAVIIGTTRRHRIGCWTRVAPLMIAVVAGWLIAGALLRGGCREP
jgi:hypothetical protein